MIRGLGILFTAIPLAVGIGILLGFDFGAAGAFGTADARGALQYSVDVPWISAIDARYFVGLDGVSLPMFELTLLVSFLCMIYTWRFLPEPGRPKAFIALLLLLETGMAGTFVSFDLVLFFVFWELVLVPMYFLIGLWGGPNREYAAIKFFLYTLFGSVFMLLGFLAMYFQADPNTFDMISPADRSSPAPCSASRTSCSPGCSWDSPSRSRCGRSTPGSPTRIPRRRPWAR